MGTRVEDVDDVLRRFPMLQRDWILKEVPQHERHVDAFHIARLPLTNQVWRVFAEATDRALPPSLSVDGTDASSRHPAWGFGFGELLAFCEWARTANRVALRPLTEPEWEKAAQGADGREYPGAPVQGRTPVTHVKQPSAARLRSATIRWGPAPMDCWTWLATEELDQHVLPALRRWPLDCRRCRRAGKGARDPRRLIPGVCRPGALRQASRAVRGRAHRRQAGPRDGRGMTRKPHRRHSSICLVISPAGAPA